MKTKIAQILIEETAELEKFIHGNTIIRIYDLFEDELSKEKNTHRCHDCRNELNDVMECTNLLCVSHTRKAKLIHPPAFRLMQLDTMFKELNDARFKVERLVKEIVNEMNAKAKEGVTWRNDQCEYWLVYQEKCKLLGDLREKYQV